MTSVPTVDLNDGHEIPQLGFGIFQIDPEDSARAVSITLEIGYRQIDTAQMYGNEKGIGEAVRVSGLDRAAVEISGRFGSACFSSDDTQVAGIMVPARRRVFPRGPDGQALISEPMTVSIDLSEIAST
jgi:diketogulonate reductase-like aldo/keto reductase